MYRGFDERFKMNHKPGIQRLPSKKLLRHAGKRIIETIFDPVRGPTGFVGVKLFFEQAGAGSIESTN
jgi:hypothetical protein